jgi:hypothetical protein
VGSGRRIIKGEKSHQKNVIFVPEKWVELVWSLRYVPTEPKWPSLIDNEIPGIKIRSDPALISTILRQLISDGRLKYTENEI